MLTIYDAYKFASVKHAGQVDKSGEAYISHPLRVAMRMHSTDGVIAALLHDVKEDCGVSDDDLRAIGASDDVIIAVDLLTKKAGMSYDDYLLAIKANPLALAVKLADIADNTDINRLAKLPQLTAARLIDKYTKALKILGD